MLDRWAIKTYKTYPSLNMLRYITILLLLLSVGSGATLPEFRIDESRRWSLSFRYWSHCTPFESAGSYAFLAEVTKLGPEPPPINQQKLPLQFRSGTMKVHELLSPKLPMAAELAKVRELIVEGVDGLETGDRVIVFVDSEPYEGDYVINFHEGGCRVGIRLPPLDDLNFGAELQNHLLRSLRENRTSLRQLTSEELSAWITVDPAGVARQFQQELEMERLQWKRDAE